MATDVFNRTVDLGTPLAADSTRMLLPYIGEEDFLLQHLAIQYQQRVTRLWEIGSNSTYFFAGRTEGTLQAKRIIGAQNAALGFITQFGDVCNMASNFLTVSLDAGCDGYANQGQITASGCVINAVAYSIQAQEMIINEDVNIMFASLQGS